jgi:phage minor structural protein
MLISLHDNYQRRIAHIDNALPKAMHYNDDKWNRNLAYGTGLFDFTIDRQDLEIESQLVVGNYISFRYNNRDYMFTILRSEKSSDDRKIIVHSEYLSLGLLKSTQDPLDPPQSHTLEWYLTQSAILVNSGIKLGINEVPDLVRKIKIDGEQTSLQRLTSFATNFGAEIEYVTTLNRDGTLKSLVVNFYKKFDGVNQGVGTNRQDLTLSYGKNISGIKQTTDITDFFSMITPKGKDGLTITSLDRTEYDDDGNVLFFTRPGQSSIYAPQSAQRFPSRLIRTNNDYTDHKYSADGTSDQNTLYTLALTELKKNCDPSIVYDVTGFYDLNIGDTVKIFDASFNPPLMLQARVAEQTISFSNPSNNKTVFGNIIALESQASQALTGRLKELVDQATPYRFEIISDNGLTFKNSTGSTTLTARVYKGSNIDEVSVDSFEWLIDGVSFGGTNKSQSVNASQVSSTAVVRYNAKIGNTVIGGIEVTIQDISDGENGISPIVTVNPDTSLTIVDAQGTSTTPVLKGSDGVPGKDGVGVKTTVITYAISTSGTTAPSTDWTSSVPSLVKGQYLWTKTVWTYTDNSSETGYTVSYISKDGNNGTNGLAGKDGVGIKTTTITYVGSTSGTTAPTTGFTTAVPSVPAGQYLWTKTVWTYTDNTTETGYSVAMMGLKGDKGDTGIKGSDGIAGKDGKGIKATAITYQASTNGTTAPTGTWSASVPTVAKGSFLWTRTIWTYTDNTTETGYAVAYMGTNGNNGTNGLAGKDGTGIKTTTITYVGSTSGTTAPTSGWTSTVPTVAAGSYLWTKTVWTYTDNTSETGYSVARMGLKGDKGDTGIKGSDGTSGIIVSSVAPASPKTGQLWQDTSTTPQLIKKWTGSSWVIWELYVENMNVNNLSALSPNLGTITGGSYTSWFTEMNEQNGYNMLNGIYLFNGRIRSLVIQSSSTINQDTVLGSNVLPTVYGTEQYAGRIRYFAGAFKLGITPNQLLHDIEPYGYWSRYDTAGTTGTSALVSEIIGYRDGISIIGNTEFKGITSQDTPWIEMGNGASYKNTFSRVYISYSIKATSTANISLGVLPVGLRPFRGLHLTANAWATTLVNDRHIEVKSTGEVTLYNPANGASYVGEVSFTI